MRGYLNRLLHKYISLYVLPEDKVVEIDPHTTDLFGLFKNQGKSIFCLSKKKEPPVSGSLKGLEEFDPDFLLLNGNLHYERDIEDYLRRLHGDCSGHVRLIITYYSNLWRPLIKLADVLGIRKKTPEHNWITHEDLDNLLYLSGFELVKRESKVLIPLYVPVLSDLINRYLAPWPFFNFFALLTIVVARPVVREENRSVAASVSIIVPARNESGNIEKLVTQMPTMGPDDEIIFVEGHSNDDTWRKIQEVQKKYARQFSMIAVQQEGAGKKDAVRKGFSLATKDIFMILDADLTVSPEDLPKFYRALVSGKGEFINGSRLVYPMEKQAMRFMNMIANKFFAIAFSFVLGGKLKDTLCGTKVLRRAAYQKIESHSAYFGDFDPFGDFDLIFGAARLGLKIIEVPVLYKERTYGSTNIRRWKHGLMLVRMLIFAARKIKFL